MVAETGRGADAGAPPLPASDVVRRRLVQLISDLQEPGSSVASRPVGRRVLESPSLAGVDAVGDPTPEDSGELAPEEWLDRLRRPEPHVVPPAEQPPAANRLVARALELGREHLAAVIVVLLVGVAWTAYTLMQARSSPVASAAPVIQASPSPIPAPTQSAAPARVVVHVIGAVRDPGVVRLAEGARVADAITAAGGLATNAAPGELNLAQVLTDGLQLKIGTTKHPGGWLRSGTDASSTAATGSAGSDPSKVSLNSATLEQLDTLPGVGPVTAQKILDWRTAHGKFTAVTELQEVDGIGPKTYADIAEHVRL